MQAAGFKHCRKEFLSEQPTTLDAMHDLGVLHADQGKLQEAETMYQCALAAREQAVAPDRTSTLDTDLTLGLSIKIRASCRRQRGCISEH
jgi:hypothetical protein